MSQVVSNRPAAYRCPSRLAGSAEIATRSVPPVFGPPAAGLAAPAVPGVGAADAGVDTDTLGAGGAHAATIDTPPTAPSRRRAERRLMSGCTGSGVEDMVFL